jgi:hypothetical protein
MLLTLLSPQGAPTGITADVAVTLDAATLSSGATIVQPSITADVSATLGSLALSATGTITSASIAADVAVTLGALSLTSSSTIVSPPITANLSSTLDALTLAGTGTIATPAITANLSITLGALSLSSDATSAQPSITANLTATLGAATLFSLAAGPSDLGGGSTQKRKTRRPGHGWEREREILEASLARADSVQSIAAALAQSKRPQAQKIAKKLADYSGEADEVESLRRELNKLERQLQERIDSKRRQDEREAIVAEAASELRAMLDDDEDALEAIAMIEDAEINLAMIALGYLSH